MTATIGKVWLPNSLQEFLVAYFLLIAGILGSNGLEEKQFVTSLGACSFGICLIHSIPMNLIKGVIAKVFPALSQQVSIGSMLTFSVSSFLPSWLTVSLLRRSKIIATYAFSS